MSGKKSGRKKIKKEENNERSAIVVPPFATSVKICTDVTNRYKSKLRICGICVFSVQG